MTMKRRGWAAQGVAIVLAIGMTLATPLACFAQSDRDAGEGLRLTFEVSPRPLVYGVVHEASVRVSNGTGIARKVKINALLGEVAHFVGGDQGVRFVQPDKPEQQRRITWPVMALGADESARVSFQFLVSWDVSGDVYLQVDAESVGEERPLEVAYLREAPQLPDGERSFLAQYGAVLISFLLFVALQVALYRRTRRKGGGLLRTLSLMAGVLLAFLAVTGLRNAMEPWFGWQATTCEVLDVRYAVDTHESRSGSGGSRSSSGRSTTTRLEIPLLTLRFETPERSIVSTGFRNQSSSTGDMGLLSQFRAGTTTDCYYDPDDPGWVVVTRDVTVTTIVISLLFAGAGVWLGWIGLRRRKGETTAQ